MRERASIEVGLPDGRTFEATCPTAEQWDRYLDKLMRGDELPGRRELVQVCASSCTPEEAVEIVRRYPGMVRPVSDALSELSASGADIEPGDGSVSVCGVTVRAPDVDAWEAVQAASKKQGGGRAIREAVTSWADDPEAAAVAFREVPGAPALAFAELGRMVGTQVSIRVKKG